MYKRQEYVEAIRKIMELPKADDFIIATGRSYSVREIINSVFEVLELDPLPSLIIDPDRLTTQPFTNPLIGDSSKLREETGWRATAGLEQIVASIINGQRAHDD